MGINSNPPPPPPCGQCGGAACPALGGVCVTEKVIKYRLVSLGAAALPPLQRVVVCVQVCNRYTSVFTTIYVSAMQAVIQAHVVSCIMSAANSNILDICKRLRMCADNAQF